MYSAPISAQPAGKTWIWQGTGRGFDSHCWPVGRNFNRVIVHRNVSSRFLFPHFSFLSHFTAGEIFETIF